MSALETRRDFEKYNLGERIYGNFSPFYVTITICTVIGFFLIILNVTFCWCSRHRNYWRDRHTGNRWLQPLWSVTPHNNPPLELSELENGHQAHIFQRSQIQYNRDELDTPIVNSDEYIELRKRESEI